jgi:ADP-heptose:LPS heptosyltransferase
LLTDVARWEPGRHEVRSRLTLLECLGINEDDHPRVSVGVTDLDRSRVARRLREAWPDRSRPRRVVVPPSGLTASEGHSRARRRDARPIDAEGLHAGRFGEAAPLLAVHLGAGTAAKRWPARYWWNVITRFLHAGWRVVIVGGPEDATYSAELPDHPSLQDWSGQLAVMETAALLERAEMFLGSDSGPAHLAACASVPSVILFSGTNRVAQWRPWSRRSLVLRRRVGCRPCHHKVCPLADHPCLGGLSPDRVYRAARVWWSRLQRRSGQWAVGSGPWPERGGQ